MAHVAQACPKLVTGSLNRAAATGSGMPCVNGRRAYPFSMLNFVTSKSLTSAVVDGVLKTPSLGQRSSMRYGRLLRG